MRALAAVLLAAGLAGCLTGEMPPTRPGEGPCVPESEPAPGSIPACIREAADATATRYLGAALAARMLTFDGGTTHELVLPGPECQKDPAVCERGSVQRQYAVGYRFRSPEQPWVDTIAGIRLASDGRVAMAEPTPGQPVEDVYGLPGCAVTPRECRFIEESTAISIARMKGLEPGIEPWTTRFFWRGASGGTYVWAVENTTHRGDCAEEGRTVLVDANDGRVIEAGIAGPKGQFLCATP